MYLSLPVMNEMMNYDFDRSLGKITQQVSKALGKKLEAKFAQHMILINAAQWSIISMLYKKVRVIQKDIGIYLGMDKVMIKRVIDQLEKKEIVTRESSKHDKRFNHIQLTQSGRELYLKLMPYALETLNEACIGIDETEMDRCIDILHQVYANIKR
jgi:DNA-binding MarR family transcriptional regulator